MVFNLWSKTATAAAITTSKQLERLRDAEQALIEIANQQQHQLSNSTTTTAFRISSNNNDDKNYAVKTSPNLRPPNIQVFDTILPIESIMKDYSYPTKTASKTYTIHGVSVTTTNGATATSSVPRCDKPLVLLHGYMNGGAYFYRNFVGLSQYYKTIYAIDQLGWGLSSRDNPSFTTYYQNKLKSFLSTNDHSDNNIDTKLVSAKNDTSNTEKGDNMATRIMVRIAESFFVESLEAWRKMMNIESMILGGHSMGGYIAVAYCEKYPQHVHQLILISPVGVPIETNEMIEARKARTTWRFRLFEYIFSYLSLGDILRTLPESIGKKWIQDYVVRRLPAITDTKEQEALAEYLYCNNGLLPGSGEYCLPKLLKPSVFGHIPLVHRIPLLKVSSCTFFYGDNDWMDVTGGLDVLDVCNNLSLNKMTTPPKIDVYQVSKAGHLLMLENSEEFNNGLILSSLLHEADLEGKKYIPSQVGGPTTKIPTKVVREYRSDDSLQPQHSIQ